MKIRRLEWNCSFVFFLSVRDKSKAFECLPWEQGEFNFPLISLFCSTSGPFWPPLTSEKNNSTSNSWSIISQSCNYLCFFLWLMKLSESSEALGLHFCSTYSLRLIDSNQNTSKEVNGSQSLSVSTFACLILIQTLAWSQWKSLNEIHLSTSEASRLQDLGRTWSFESVETWRIRIRIPIQILDSISIPIPILTLTWTWTC